MDLGTDRYGFGYGGTGKKSHNRQFDTYGEEFKLNDTIGCYIDLEENFLVGFTKNGGCFLTWGLYLLDYREGLGRCIHYTRDPKRIRILSCYRCKGESL